MRLLFALAVLLAAACSSPTLNIYGALAAGSGGASSASASSAVASTVASTETVAASSTASSASAGGGGGAASATSASAASGSGGAGGAATTTAASSSSVGASSASSSAGAGGAPPECSGATDGTQCTETCGCPPCGPPQQAACAWGLCKAGACVAYTPVVCKLDGPIGKTYSGCDGSASAVSIDWDTGSCPGFPNDPHYCAPGKTCFVFTKASPPVEIGQGVCQ